MDDSHNNTKSDDAVFTIDLDAARNTVVVCNFLNLTKPLKPPESIV